MNEQRPEDTGLTTKAQQIERLQAWLEDAKHRIYLKRDKRRYVKLEYDNQSVTMPPSEALDWISDSEDATYLMSEVWMTEAQYNKLPEFEGF